MKKSNFFNFILEISNNGLHLFKCSFFSILRVYNSNQNMKNIKLYQIKYIQLKNQTSNNVININYY